MKKKRVKKNNIRYSVLIIVLALFLFAVMIGRVIYLGISPSVDGVNLQSLASKRTTKTDIISASRGTIYTSDGDALAQNVASYKLLAYLDPKRTTDPKKPYHVVDKEYTALKLSEVIDMSYEDILYRLNKDKDGLKQTYFGVAGNNLNQITKKKIDDLELPGIGFEESFIRYYPKGDFASYVVGYAKKSDDDETIKGELGIEKEYNTILKGEDGYVTYQKDLKGYKIPDTNEIRNDAVQGKDIYLTIDSNIQFFIEQAINNSHKTYDWEWFTITIMDAKTGAILGTATNPSFDPNKRNMTRYMDVFCQTPYEPGSTMKTFTYMAAMENGVYDGNETYKSGVYVTSDGTEIGDWDRNGWGVITFDKGYALSSNVGVINIIERHMNSLMLRQYFKRLGFGKKTGIELSGESAGKLGFKYETEIFNAGFGQGITTTPVQNVKAMTPLTNDGILLEPYIVSKIVDSETGKVTLQNERHEIERVASTQTVNKMIQLMDDTVNGYGNTGSGYRIAGGELIGKTGTAQIARENGGGYLQGKSDIISSFAGIYPKSNPQVIIYASVSKPTNGSQRAISIPIKEIVNNISKYYGNNDTYNSTVMTVEKYTVPSFVNRKTDYAKTALDAKGISYQIIGNGDKIVKQTPTMNSDITSFDKVYLITNDLNIKIPNVVGLSSKVAGDLLSTLGVSVKYEGVGYVISQSIPEGSDIASGLEITLGLAPKFNDNESITDENGNTENE